jgi:hypothetical protein
MHHDRIRALPFFIGDFMEARYVGIGLLLVRVADEVAIGTEPRNSWP